MKTLGSVHTDKVELEIIECDCGFHLGLDSTYLDQVADIFMSCPSCGKSIDTRILFPEDAPESNA